jgi:hypothetical protein
MKGLVLLVTLAAAAAAAAEGLATACDTAAAADGVLAMQPEQLGWAVAERAH